MTTSHLTPTMRGELPSDPEPASFFFLFLPTNTLNMGLIGGVQRRSSKAQLLKHHFRFVLWTPLLPRSGVTCYYHPVNYKQYLPTYRHDFETDQRFVSSQSPHYIFHYFPNSEAERDIDTITETQENAYKKIISFLKVEEPGRPIEYYFYPDEKIKNLLMGDNWYAQSVYDEFRVHVLYTSLIKPVGPHEDTHLLSLPWGLSIGFFQEGLAEYMVGHAWDGKSHIEYVKEGYRKDLYLPISEFMRHETWLETDNSNLIYFYSLAGAFVSFLIQAYGKKFFELYYKTSNREKKTDENTNAFLQIYGLDIKNAEQLFKSSLGD